MLFGISFSSIFSKPIETNKKKNHTHNNNNQQQKENKTQQP